MSQSHTDVFSLHVIVTHDFHVDQLPQVLVSCWQPTGRCRLHESQLRPGTTAERKKKKSLSGATKASVLCQSVQTRGASREKRLSSVNTTHPPRGVHSSIKSRAGRHEQKRRRYDSQLWHCDLGVSGSIQHQLPPFPRTLCAQ